MITGINHVTFAVRDLSRSFYFYREVLKFRPVARWEKGAYFEVGEFWFCLIEDEKTRSEALPEYTHVAFTVSPGAFESVSKSLRKASVPLWKENVSEGPSLYFLDPDGHKLEIHAGDLRSRLQALREKPRPGLEILD